MKKIILGFSSAVIGLALLVVPTFAANQSWNLTGTYIVNYVWNGGNYYNDLTLTQSGNNITGTMNYPSPGPYTVLGTVTGTVTGNTVNFTVQYNDRSYLRSDTGTIASDGKLSGTWNDANPPANDNGTWMTTSGTATLVRPERKLVLVSNLQPSWTAQGGGGVYSAYYGPPDYNPVSPGTTAVYKGLEAGPIYAGLAKDPTHGDYEDQGLFAFQPGETPVANFAKQPLTYEFVNQFGANPVWVYIELNKGKPGDTMYQYVPTSNPLNWHTEDAASGTHWQKWTDTYSGITTGPMVSLTDIANANPGATVSRVYLTEGMGNAYHDNPKGTVAWVHEVRIGETTYDFVTKNQCDNDGWRIFGSPSFKNQGQCIDFMDHFPKVIPQPNDHKNNHKYMFNH